MPKPTATPDQVIVTLRLQRWFDAPPLPYSRNGLKVEFLRFFISETGGDPEDEDGDHVNNCVLLDCLEGLEVEPVEAGEERTLEQDTGWPRRGGEPRNDNRETRFQALIRSRVRFGEAR